MELLLLFILPFFLLGILDGCILYMFNINSFWSCVKKALGLNLSTLFLVPVVLYNSRDGYDHFMITWLIAVLIEAVLLMKFNPGISWKKLWIASLTTNSAGYLLLIGSLKMI